MKNRFNHTSTIIRHPYSLVEMLMVIAIIAILAGIGAGGYTVARRWLAQSRTEALLAKLKIAIESYKNDKGYYPLPQGSVVNFKLDTNAKDFTSGTHTGAELQPRNNMNNFVDYSKIQQDQSFKVLGNPNIYYVKDGWNAPVDGENFGAIKYECPGTVNKTSFDIYSAGNDRKFASNPATDTEDDVYVKF